METIAAQNAPPGRRVLLVDDEDRFTTQLGRLLERRHFHVVTAGDGQQALALIADQRFDVVVLDIRMPVMDGMTALHHLQANPSAPPVIMLTGHATLETGIEAIRQGAFDYLMKPCSTEDLVAKLNAACTIGQMRRRPILWPRSTAGELILDAFRRIENTAPLVEALSVINHRLPRMAGETLFIVDAGNHLAGHLNKQDVIRLATRPESAETLTWEELSANPQWLPDIDVEAAMQKETITVAPDTPLRQVAEIMMANRIRTLPVTDEDHKVLGVIRLKDALFYINSAGAPAGERSAE